MVHKHVVARDGVEQVVLRAHASRDRGLERRVLEVRPVHQVVHGQQPIEVDGTVDLVERAALEAELVQQEVGHVVGAVVGDLQAHAVAVAARGQLALEREQQVVDLLLVDEQVGVARHAELVAAVHAHAREQLLDERMDDRGQEHEVVLAVARQVRRQLDDAGQRARRLHDRGPAAAPECVLAAQRDDEVQ